MATVNATWKQKSTGNIIHPETDVDQLKSSGQNALASIITTLLKSATTAQARQAIESAAAVHQHSTGDIQSFASNVVSAIGEETLAALGVRYSITTNGYICFGQLFGGLILQWTHASSISAATSAELDDNTFRYWDIPNTLVFPNAGVIGIITPDGGTGMQGEDPYPTTLFTHVWTWTSVVRICGYHWNVSSLNGVYTILVASFGY
jgi:hypothetical protein